MCGGVIGKVDKFLGKHTDPLTRWTDHIIGGPIGRAGHWTQNHPLETAGAALAAYYGLAAGGEYFGGGGDAAVGAGETAGAVAEGGTAMGPAAGTLGAADSSAASDALGYTAADVGGTSSADLAATAGGAGATGATADSGGSWLSSLFKGSGAGGGGGSSWMTGKNALGAMQVLSALYGMEQSKKIQNQASKQAVTAAGEQAVMRSMAAQGYQGSGNMMTALSNYAAGAYGSNLPVQASAVSGQLSSLGLLSAGAGNLAGWNTGAQTTQTGG